MAALAAGLSALGGGTPGLADDRPSTKQVCGGDEIARGTVGRILDGRTFMLNDGRDVRLAAIEVAPWIEPPGSAATQGAHTAAAALKALAAGDEVALRRAEKRGAVAYAYTVREGHELLLQRELVADGLARVGGRIGSACAGDLLKREKAAREAKLGLWADPYYEVLKPKRRGMHWRIEADLRWSRAKSPPCAKADPQSM
jgi:endonuclease YncB( thermonuclease family)